MRGVQTLCQPLSATLLASSLLVAAAQAQLTCDRVFPTAVSTGSTLELTAEGEFPAWPPRFECDRADIEIEPMEAKGRFQIRSSADAPHGIAWMRLFDEHSASQLVPLLLEPISTAVENEPNNELTSAQTLELPCTISGRLEKNGDIDVYQIPCLPGQILSATVIANQVLGSPMDAVLQITDAAGNVLAQNDDSRGLDPQLNFACPADEAVFLRIFAFPQVPNSTIGFAGGKEYTYALRLTAEPVVDHWLPLLAPNDMPGVFLGYDNRGAEFQAPSKNLSATSAAPLAQTPTILPATFVSPRIVLQPSVPGWQWIPEHAEPATCILDTTERSAMVAKLPAICSGHIATPGEVDSFRIEVVKDRKYRAEVFSHRFGFGLDSVLRVVDPDDRREIASNDDLARNQYDAAIEFTAPKDGRIELQISDLAKSGGSQHAYSMIVGQIRPSLELLASADRFSIQAGQTIDIEITVNRIGGFAGRLQFEIAPMEPDSPLQGISHAALISEPQGESAKSVRLKLQANEDLPNAHHAFRIVAREVATDESIRPASMATAVVHIAKFQVRPNLFLDRLWLTTQAKK